MATRWNSINKIFSTIPYARSFHNISILDSGTSDHVTNLINRLFNYRPVEGVYALCGSGYVQFLGFGDLKLRLQDGAPSMT